MRSTLSAKTYIKCFIKFSLRAIVLTIALFVFQSDSLAQQGTLTDNATFPANISALTVQGSSATEGAAASFIKFKLTPNLPLATPGTSVAKATLTLFLGSVNAPGSFDVCRVTSPWGEGDTNAPTYDAANPVVSGVQVTAAGSYVTVDLTALAQQWLGSDGLGTGGVPNYGIALVANTTTTAFTFDSKGSTTTSHPAQLAILLNRVATAETATDFTGLLGGDVTGPQNAAVVSSVGSQSAASVANSTIAVNAATNTNTPNTIVKRDAAGNFSAGTMAGDITGNAATATNATNADVAKSVNRAAQDDDIVSPANGQVYYNTTSNVFKVFDGPTSTWKIVDAGNAATLSSSAPISGNQVNGELTNATIAGTRITGPITNGSGNVLSNDATRGIVMENGALFGQLNRAFAWENFAGGTGNYLDGKITSALGNTNIGTANDSFVAGNRNVVGRRSYEVLSQGEDDPGLGVGVRAFVIVSAKEGDISGYFPNAQYDIDPTYVLATYGLGATSVDGNIYAAGLSSPADLTWAMHPYMIVRSSVIEPGLTQTKILKATYSEAGTKIYYDSASSIFPTISHVYSSYSPSVNVYGIPSGNGQFAAGLFTSSWGYGAIALGYDTKAWNYGAHAQGRGTRATGAYSSASGYFSVASGDTSTASGYEATASGIRATAIGRGLTVSGTDSVGISLNNLNGTTVSADNVLSIMGGNVGIGTTSPAAMLDIAGRFGLRNDAIRINSNALSGYSGNLSFGVSPATPGNYVAAAIHAENSDGTANDGGVLRFETAAPDASHTLIARMSINQLGNVGIGTTAPREKVELVGNLKLSGAGNGIFFPDGTKQTTAPNPIDAILNQKTQQAGADFNISGDGTIGGTLTTTTINVAGTLSAGSFSGNGSALTNLNASNITAGQLDNARLGLIPTEKGGTGLSTPGTSGNLLRSDGITWKSAPLSASELPSGNANYIQSNPLAQQAGVGFNIGGSGMIGTDLNVGGVLSSSSINATTQYNQGGKRVLLASDNGSTLGGNLYVGFGAGQNNTPGTPTPGAGTSNTFVGPNAGTLNTSGATNTFVGTGAGQTNLTGSGNTIIGAGANVGAPDLTNAIAIGGLAQATKSNQVVLGNSSVTETLLQGKVGIGTTSPAVKLEVAGQFGQGNTAVRINSSALSGYSGNLSFGVSPATPGNYVAAAIHAESSDGTVNDGGVLRFETAAPDASHTLIARMSINQVGNVGIGTTAPVEKVEVVGNLKLSGAGNGILFPDGTKQTTASGSTGGPTITSVTAGTGLSGGGTSGNVTLNVNQGVVAFQSDLASEVSARQSAGTTLQTNINNEASTRAAADTALQTAVAGRVAKAGDTMSGTLNLPTNGLVVGSNQMVLSASNVGIGTDTPQTKLQVNGGNVYVGSAGQGIVLKSPNGLVCKVLTIDNTGAMVLSAITCP
jgi:hypothetical protein